MCTPTCLLDLFPNTGLHQLKYQLKDQPRLLTVEAAQPPSSEHKVLINVHHLICSPHRTTTSVGEHGPNMVIHVCDDAKKRELHVCVLYLGTHTCSFIIITCTFTV